MKILIIDDSDDARTVAKARLAPEGHEIICEDKALKAVEVATAVKPDLILLDVDMPGMSGFEVCRRLKRHEDLNMVPVIFLSGSCNAGDKVIGLDLGAVDYVTKPFDTFELRARVRAALRTKHLQDILRDKALIDPLTELGNRRAFDDRLNLEWSRAMRYNLNLSMILADIDMFKKVNDEYGHQAGDEVLRQVAGRLSACLRDCDAIFRYGGEEFAALLPQTPLDGAMDLAQRLRANLADEPVTVQKQQLQVTASFGASSNTQVSDANELFVCADNHLYEAKASGRNCIRPLNTTPAPQQESNS